MKATIRRKQLTAAITAAILAGSGPAAVAQVDLSQLGTTHPGFRIDGDKGNDYSGTSVSGAGDVDGDGLADIVSGAPNADGSSADIGKGYLVFARANGSHLDIRNIGSNGSVISGTQVNEFAGNSVSGAGDVNGDGIADVIVGARRLNADADYYREGGAFVVFGNSAGGFEIRGPNDYSYAGTSVSSAGDVNGDGLDDLLVGAPGAYGGGSSFIVFGKSDNNPIELATLGSRGFEIGNSFTYGSGNRVSGAGDVNGDGLDDVLIDAGSSSVFVIFGKTDTNPIDLDTVGSGGFRIDVGTSAQSLAGAGDVNGDGLSDLIVGAPNAYQSNFNSGIAYVVFGKAGTTTVNLGSLGAGEGFLIEGYDYDQAGRAVAGTGDVNGDGFADLIVGVGNINHPNGAAFVVFGKTTGSTVFLNDVDSNIGGFRIDGEASGDKAGYSVSSAGDVNGDGLSDMVIGAQNADVIRGPYYYGPYMYGPYYYTYNQAGKTYVVFSDETPPVPQASYQARAKAGDAPRQAIGVIGDGSNASTPDSRMWVDFADGSNISTQTALIHRDVVTLGGDGVSAGVHWQLSTTRSGFSSAEVALKYTDAEISGIAESRLTIFQADTEAGPYTPLATTRDPARNTVSANLGSFSGTVLALGVAPEIDLQNAGAASIADGGSDNIGSRTAGTPVNLTYTILNTGSGSMSVSSPTAGGSTNISGFAVTQAPTGPVAPGGSTTFDIQFTPDFDGAFSLALSFSNGDADENPYDFTITGTAVGEPEINVRRSGMNIPDGNTDDLGDIILGPVGITYTVVNNAAATKNLTVSAPTFAAPSNVSALTVTDPPSSPLSPGQSTTFSVEFNIDDFGAFGFDMDIANNDANESNYDIRVTGNATDTQTLDAPAGVMAGDSFGSAVAGSGNLLVVGVPTGGTGGMGEVIVYRVEGSNLTIEARINVPDGFTAQNFGAALALEGDRLVIGAPGTPPPTNAKGPTSLQAALYQRLAGGNWMKMADMSSSGGQSDDMFGASVAMQGGSVVIGAPEDDSMGDQAGAAYVFEFDEGDNMVASTKVMPPSPTTGGKFGTSVATTGGQVAISAPGGGGTGAVNIWQAVGANLSNQQPVIGQQAGNGDEFGMSISMDGGMLVVGAPGDDTMGVDAGAAYVFDVSGDNFVQTQQFTPAAEAGAGFGMSVSLSGQEMAIGAPNLSAPSGGKGGVYGFKLNGLQTVLLQALQNQLGFGASVSFQGGSFVVGAPQSFSSQGSVVVKRDPGLLFRGGFELE